MPATSKAQQRLFGLAYAIKKGDMERSEADAKAVEIADSMSLKDLKKFAETDHEGLPDKVKESLVNEGKGLSEASKLIKTLRDKVYPKLNDDELSEFKKEMVEHLGGTIEENLSPGNIGGMGPVGFPSNFNGAADGSGDVPAGRGDAEEEYKKKKKEREEELKKNKNESMIFTNFNQFLNEEYEAAGKYNTVKKVIKELGRRPSEKEVAEFVIANLKDVTGISPKELEDSRKTHHALDKIADIVAFYKFDDVEWNGIFQDAINNAPFEWEVDYGFDESIDEGKVYWDNIAKEVANRLKGGSWQWAIKNGIENITPKDIGSVLIAGGYTTNSGVEKNIGGIMDKVSAFLKESVNEGRDDVTFTIDDGNLDNKFLMDRSLSRNLDYNHDSGDQYYVLPKRDFDRLEDYADSHGYDADTIYVIDESEELNETKIEDLHFETDVDRLEGMKIEFGSSFGGVTDHEKIEDAEYQLKKFRKKIKYGKNPSAEVFIPGSYEAATSKLGDGPHAKKKKKIRWTEKKYNEWIDSVAANGGAEHAFDMAQNAKNEPGLVDWVKKNLTYDETPLERIQYDIEALAESLHEANASNAREDLGYVAFLEEMSDLNSKDIQKAYSDAIDILEDKGMTEKQAVGFLNSPHGKYMGEYVAPANDYSLDAFLDKLDEYYNERMLKKLAKDFEKLG